MTNNDLTSAKKAKKDEFYTYLEDIEKEILGGYYDLSSFKDKVIYCPCDVATEEGRIKKSNFIEFFQCYADTLKYKKLVATCLSEKGEEENNKYVLIRRETNYLYSKEQGVLGSYEENGKNYAYFEGSTSSLKGDNTYSSGDFRSKECLEILKDSDIVVTNPPFSLFREFINLLFKYDKKFLVIGNINSITCKDIFPLIRDNKVWLGGSIHSGDRKFEVPDDYDLAASTCGIDEQNKRYVRVKGVRWFTNLDLSQRHEPLALNKCYDKSEYTTYDNYDAINVNKTKDIPKDYDGIMGVPITYLDKYCSEQFEIIGLSAHNFNDIHKEGTSWNCVLDGKELYKRLFIRKLS